MSSEKALSVHGLSKCYHIYDRPQDRLKQAFSLSRRTYYREFWALRDVDLTLLKGETLGVIGRNGSGKSTLLQLICGTLTPTSGDIRVEGRLAALLELGAGFNPEFSGRENVQLNAALHGLTPAEIEARFDAILAFADIGDFVDQPVKTYSSGMFVRLAFAVIAHVDADILIIDEALAVGDGFFTQKCMRFLRQFREHGTLLFVSHDIHSVMNLCDRAIWLDHGRVQRIGAAKETCETYLADLHAQQRRELGVSETAIPPGVTTLRDSTTNTCPKIDQRLPYLNTTSYRNDIEVFDFEADSESFGAGGAHVLTMSLQDAAGRPLAWVVGGSEVRLVIRVQAIIELRRPIVGFFVKDRLGQRLFGDNTYLTYADRPQSVQANERFEAMFHFAMPILPPGEYSIDIAVADGTQSEHIQHQWAHDALMFRAHTSSVASGLMGIPMIDIQLRHLN